MKDEPQRFTIRLARTEDADVINEIYNHYVCHSTCSFQTDPSTHDERLRWLEAHGEGHPVLVAETAGGEVLGWASVSPYHTRCAYRFTVEDSIYIRNGLHGRGVGSALLAALVARCERAGHHSIIAMIAADQPASLALHRKFAFAEVAHLREVGYKFDRWIDVVFMQRMLAK